MEKSWRPDRGFTFAGYGRGGSGNVPAVSGRVRT